MAITKGKIMERISNEILETLQMEVSRMEPSDRSLWYEQQFCDAQLQADRISAAKDELEWGKSDCTNEAHEVKRGGHKFRKMGCIYCWELRWSHLESIMEGK